MSYFNNKQIVDLNDLIINSDKYYAHIDDERKEKLIEHINLSNNYFLKLNDYKEIYKSFFNIEEMYLKDFSKESKDIFRALIINTINFHDLGKINPLFQELKMKNKIYDGKELLDIKSNHSIISSVFIFQGRLIIQSR